MSRPIKLTSEQTEAILSGIKDKLAKMKIFDGKLKLNMRLDETDKSANLVFTPTAYSKMLMLVQSFDSEVAWHGVVVRQDNTFVISDIVVYPQEVSGATVNTDQEEYEKWLMALDDTTFNHLRMQGHSHVNMSTSPSGVDESHQERIIEQLGDEDYYIFLIWNKKNERTVIIYDMASNTLFDTDDVTLYVGETPLDDKGFLRGAKELVKSRKYYSKSKSSKETKDELDNWRIHYGYDYERAY